MFTVKVREADGSEVVFEAIQVRKYIRPQQSSDQAIAGKILCDVHDGQISYDIPSVALGGSADQTLWVMNRDGATVATYHLG